MSAVADLPHDELILQYEACAEMNQKIGADNLRLQRELETAHHEKAEQMARAESWASRYREILLEVNSLRGAVAILKEGASVAALTDLSALAKKQPLGRALEPGELMATGDYQEFNGDWLPVLGFQVGRRVTVDARVIRPVTEGAPSEGLE